MAKKKQSKTEIYFEEIRDAMNYEFGLLKERMDRINRNLDKWHENALEFAKMMKKQEDLLSKVLRTNETVEESLANVYLAIRQNEYL